MMKRPPSSRSFSRFALTAAVLALFAGPAMAQMSDEYNPLEKNIKTGGIKQVMVSLVRPAKAKEGEFAIRMSGRYGISGCPKVGTLPYTAEFQDNVLNIGAGHFKVDYNNLPLHPEYECSGRAVYPAADVPLSLDVLKEKGTEKIRFQTNIQSEFPGSDTEYDISEPDYFKVIYGDHYIELRAEKPQVVDEPSYSPSIVMDHVKNPMKLWFYPKGTVILRANGAPKGADVRGAMDTIARAHSLVPLETVYKEFTSPIDDAESFYYVDKSKKQFVAKRDGIRDGIPLDTINMPSTVYGAEGDETIERPVQIFAHTPNAYE